MRGARREAIRKDVKRDVWEKTKGHCWYCGVEVGKTPEKQGFRENIDHQHPVSRGGKNDIGNLVLACWWCNIRKNDSTLEEYRLQVGETWAEFFTTDAENDWHKIAGSHDSFGFFLPDLIKDIVSYLRRANFLFYGEMLLVGETNDYQI